MTDTALTEIMKILKLIKWAISAVLCLCLLCGAAALIINAHVKSSTKNMIVSPQDAADLEGVDCILVLGCLVRGDGSPSHMLEDRIKRGVQLYETGCAPKIIMSGDHGRETYDEVGTMKSEAVKAGIVSSDVFEDHAGFSTYESLYRAKAVFEAEKIIVVTQEYHLYRALYIAEQLGIEAYGVAADYRTYSGQSSRDVREVLARVKDFGMVIIKPEPTYLGEIIPVSSNGDLTDG